ncbi:FtsK/SpoIIIE domain-containing protein [Kitasatospora sp. MAP5-34]|uniref:FtsK/SpoIIIE domain-containing protein n=1 Tax=Kitasatospora sp. MAP5-34 TaxID=3035102 RepID=UPI0024751D0C|nr:FtsK/SpoIIIE domain-containing protein [Kitasatospora sp. MAP5-34]MDH6577189.1 hypothetical protein [Kitasatospora sp. MAP5-34]
MQIRLTVLRPRSGPAAAGSCTDVLVTAPIGTTLGTVAGALAGAVGVRGPRSATHVHLYAGTRRVDEQALLGHPPLLDGAILSLNEPDPDADEAVHPATAELRVIGGPDAGGVHRLHGEQIRVGRSSEADVPLDDPDVSRLHLSLHLGPDGRVTVRDLGSTNGTTLDGRFLRADTAELPEGGLLRVGESTLLLAPPDPAEPRQATPDGLGHLQLSPAPPARSAPTTPAPEPTPDPPAPGRARALLSRRLGRSGPAEQPPAGAAQQHAAARTRQAAGRRERWPDPASLLLTALAPGPRLWERGPGHPDALTVRLGTADLPGGAGTAPGTVLPGVPVTVDLKTAGSLGLAGPRERLAGLARAVLAQLAALHPPSSLSTVLVSPDETRAADWTWALWLPHLRPAHGQDCRLLVGFDPVQAEARLDELTAPDPATRPPATVVLLDGDPDTPAARRALERLLRQGPALGVFPICLAEHPDELPDGLGATGLITGEVSTQLTVTRPAMSGHEVLPDIALDAVSAAWAERLARVLAPLREATPNTRGPLPGTLRLLDLLHLDTVTPAKLSARWAALPVTPGTAAALLGTTRDDLCTIDLADPDLTAPGEPGGPHLLVGGAKGSGKTELLRTLIASLAVSERPERLTVTVVEGRGSTGTDDPAGLRGCTDLPHVTTHVDAAADPRHAMLAAEALLDELTHREELLGELDFASWHSVRAHTPALVAAGRAGSPDAPRIAGPRQAPEARAALPARLVVVVDDYDALLSPTSPAGRPLARALAAVAQRGGRLGMHLVAATGAPEETAGSEVDEAALLRIALRTGDPADSDLLIHLPDAAALTDDTPGRGYLRRPDGGVTAFQTARVSGRIPRTATLRPTVVAVDRSQLGAPPTRRPVRELGNGPTDLALLASALQRAAAQ